MSARTKTEEGHIPLMPSPSELADAGILTERQSEAYLLREIEGHGRKETADLMGLSMSRVDDLLREARDKVEAVHETAEVLERADEYREMVSTTSD